VPAKISMVHVTYHARFRDAFTLRPNLAFYIGLLAAFGPTARHSRSGRQPNCAVQQRAPLIVGRAAITLGIGPHSSLDLYLEGS